MKYLFLLAHPDNEMIGSGGTIRKLANEGHEVIVILATDGAAGIVPGVTDAEIKKAGGVSKLRKKEFIKSCEILGVRESRILDFKDGHITNEMVWGDLTETYIELIDEIKPDVVITFDHSGWYFHLDHIAVSIAATRAVQRAEHQVDVLLFVLNRPLSASTKWKYVYAKAQPVTHEVDISDVLKDKIKAMEAHKSQNITGLEDHLKTIKAPRERYQLAHATKVGKQILKKSKIFKTI